MKVFVTGGAGYIGSVTVDALLAAGHGVCVFDNMEKGHRSALRPGAAFVQGDLRERDVILRAVREAAPDAIMHFAAYALVGESMERPDIYFRNNTTGSANLIEAATAAGVRRFVFSSTCATYGDPDVVPIRETSRQLPTNPYGESKLMVEKMLLWAARIHKLEHVCLRYFNAAGAVGDLGEDHDPESHLIPIVLQTALGQREKVRVFGTDYDTPDGTCIRDYIHVADLASAHLAALSVERSGAYNLGNGDGHSVLQIIETARQVTGRAIACEAVARRPGDPPRLVADASLARSTLGWNPRRAALTDIIEDAWKWHQAHPRGYGD